MQTQYGEEVKDVKINENSNLVCPICSNKLSDGYEKIPYPSKGSQWKESIQQPNFISFCPNCTVGMASPMLRQKDIDSLYSEGEYWSNRKVKAISIKKYITHYVLARDRWKFIEPHFDQGNGKPSVSMLDIGAGHGFMGIAAAKSSHIHLKQYVAVEADNWIRKSLELTWSKKFPNIKIKTDDKLNKINEKFDIIVLSHIMEHLPDPLSMIKTVIPMLSNSGLLYIDVPYKDYLTKKDVSPHVIFYNKKSLSALLERNHLKPKFIDYFGNNPLKSPPSLIYKMRHFVPLSLSVNYYSGILGADKSNPNGIWVRTLAQPIQ